MNTDRIHIVHKPDRTGPLVRRLRRLIPAIVHLINGPVGREKRITNLPVTLTTTVTQISWDITIEVPKGVGSVVASYVARHLQDARVFLSMA